MAASASPAVARRYAGALFSAALHGDQLDAVERDLTYIDGLLQRSPQMLAMMRNPLIPAPRKQQILDQILSGGIGDTVLRFFHLLVEKRRSEVLPQIHALYVEMSNEHQGIAPAFAASAVALTPEETQALTARLEALTGKRIVLHTEVRPELIGGMRVRVGDTVIDGSVVGYLRQIRERLRHTLV